VSVGEEDRGRQIDSNFREGLPLRFVDGHGEGRPHWKLTPTELAGNVLVLEVVSMLMR
jgi:hypothetical protein